MSVVNWRRWFHVIHRDLGYFFFGMTLIYAISGIILNHFKSGDFNHPDYTKSSKTFNAPLPAGGTVDKNYALKVLKTVGEEDGYKSFVSGTGYVDIFIKYGSVYVDLNTGDAELQKKTPRYILKDFNLLHYNNIKKLYTWYSDIYAVGLILLAITGLFVLKGKNGIIGRGAWLTLLGILIPALFILIYR